MIPSYIPGIAWDYLEVQDAWNDLKKCYAARFAVFVKLSPAFPLIFHAYDLSKPQELFDPRPLPAPINTSSAFEFNTSVLYYPEVHQRSVLF